MVILKITPRKANRRVLLNSWFEEFSTTNRIWAANWGKSTLGTRYKHARNREEHIYRDKGTLHNLLFWKSCWLCTSPKAGQRLKFSLSYSLLLLDVLPGWKLATEALPTAHAVLAEAERRQNSYMFISMYPESSLPFPKQNKASSLLSNLQ